MEFFEGGKLEHRVMEKSGCLNYTTTSWEFVKPDIVQRHISYQFDHSISIFEGKVTCIQQKLPMAAGNGEEEWVLNEVMSLHDVPFGDCFRVCNITKKLLTSLLLKLTSPCVKSDQFVLSFFLIFCRFILGTVLRILC